MATAKKATAEKQYKITVDSNPNYCGIDAGGVQFAYGQAIILDGRMVDWFKEHEGYTVTEITADTAD